MANNLKKKKDFILALVAIIIAYGMLYVTGIGCPIKYLTGISCAGCGMTRAWICLLKCDISGAYYHHPLFVLPVVFLIWYLLKNKINRKIYKIGVILIIIIFMTVYLVRLFNPSDLIVVFEPDNNIVNKIKCWV